MNGTASQRCAIESNAKKIVVVAGPGSGKTTTTIARIVRLVEDGVAPSAMVAITFTNAGADELLKRLAAHYGEEKRFGFVGTLHAFALRMLKIYGTRLGFGSRTSLISEDGTKELLMQHAKRLGYKQGVDMLLKWRERAMACGGAQKHSRFSDEERVVRAYEEQLRMGGMVDFNTILSEFLRLVRGGVELPYTHLFVDERQDSSEVDCEIYDQLPMTHKFSVGDPDQSIYAFRGGRPDLLVQYAQRKDVEVITLEENFRSHAEICEAAQRLIERNVNRVPKATISTKGRGAELHVLRCENEGDEAAQITNEIRALGGMVPDAKEFGEMAVLCRFNYQLPVIREQLRAAGISLAEAGRTVFPKDWALAKAWVGMCANPFNDTLAYFYLIAMERAKGGSEVFARNQADAIRMRAQGAGMSIAAWVGGAAKVGADCAGVLVAAPVTQESRTLLAEILRTLPDNPTLLDFALAVDRYKGDEEPGKNGVTVSTMHGAKGREWDTVFIAGMEQELLPGRSDVEEERRLAYVALTRARIRVIITHARYRTSSWGKVEAHTPSQFIKEAGL